MKRLTLLLLVALAAPSLSAQGDCDSLCVFPETAPQECLCTTVIGFNASSDVNNPNPEAKELIDRMRDEYAQAVAGVDDYIVVQTTDAGGPPVVLYYEKEIIDHYPAFRFVSPAELANREAEARGDPTAQDIAGGIAALLGSVGGGGNQGEGGNDGSSGDGANAMQGSGDQGGNESGSDGGLGSLLGQVAETFEDIAQSSSELETRDDLADQLMRSTIFYERADILHNEDISVGGEIIEDCAVLYVDQNDFEIGELADLFGEGYERFHIVSAKMWVTTGHERKPVAMEAVLAEIGPDGPVGACPPQPDADCYIDGITIRRTYEDYREETPWLSRKYESSIDGLTKLVGDIVSDFSKVITHFVRVLVNTGGLSQQEQVELMAEIMQQQ